MLGNKTLEIIKAAKDVSRSYKDIAKEFGVSRQYVGKIAKKYAGIENKRNPIYTKIENYLRKNPNADIKTTAKKNNCTLKTASKHFKANNIENQWEKQARITQEMYSLRQQGMKYKDIAAIYGSTTQNCCNRLNRYKRRIENGNGIQD